MRKLVSRKDSAAALCFWFHFCLHWELRQQLLYPSPLCQHWTERCPVPAKPGETFPKLTFNIADADSMEEDNVLVRHLPHHARCLKECLLGSERGQPWNCWSLPHSSQCLTTASIKEQNHLQNHCFSRNIGGQQWWGCAYGLHVCRLKSVLACSSQTWCCCLMSDSKMLIIDGSDCLKWWDIPSVFPIPLTIDAQALLLRAFHS